MEHSKSKGEREKKSMTFSIEKKLERIPKDQLEYVLKRLELIKNSLPKGVYLRDDSRLAYAWATGNSDLELDKVVREITGMYQLFEKTDYGQVSRKVVAQIHKDLYDHYGLDTTTCGILATRYGTKAVKNYYQNLSDEKVTCLEGNPTADCQE